MSLVSMVDEAIRQCNAEEVRMIENINQCREILASMRPGKKRPKETESSNVLENVPDSTLKEEREEMELLERVLEKALRIRSSSAPTKETLSCPEPSKDIGQGDALKNAKHSAQAGSTKGKSPGIRPTSKPSATQKELLRSSVPSSSRGGRRVPHHHGHSRTRALVKGSMQRSVDPAKGLLGQSSMREKQTVHGQAPLAQVQLHSEYNVCVENSDRDTAPSEPIHEDPVPVSPIEGTTEVHQQTRLPSQMPSKWRTLGIKQNRLWDKVMAVQSKPVPERTRFVERTRATFPREWPSGSPEDTLAQIHKLTGLGQNLTHYYETQLLLANQTSRTGTQPAPLKEYESWLMFGGLEKMMADLIQRADGLRQEWGAWDRWRPAEGSSCPVCRRGGWREAGRKIPAVPPTVTYSSLGELRELERLRLGLELLEQEMHLQQVLCDSLSPCLTSMLSGPGRPLAAPLRDIYALLGEGGEQFPALVLDTEPE